MANAIRVHRFGGPEVLDFEAIECGAPGTGEVLLRQKAIGLNFIDIYHREGRYPNPLPFTPGSEAAGEVLAVGLGVDDLKPGDRVAYGTAIGAYAEERLISAEKLFKLSDALSFETGAAMMLKGLTVQYLVHQTYPLKAGDTILVHAAAGGIGLILCQWAKALGATVIGTVGSDEKARLAREHGADAVVLYNTEDFVARVKDITKGRLCDVVYDGVGKTTFPASLDCLRPRGMFVSFGSASGPVEAFDIGLLARKGSLFATRPSLGNYASDRSSLVTMANDLTDVIASGAVKIDVTNRFALKDAAEAHRALEGRKTTGVSVLIP